MPRDVPAVGIEIELEGEEEYDVEAIVNEDVIDEIPCNEINWKGWPSSANTWEPIDRLEICRSLVEKYNPNG